MKMILRATTLLLLVCCTGKCDSSLKTSVTDSFLTTETLTGNYVTEPLPTTGKHTNARSDATKSLTTQPTPTNTRTSEGLSTVSSTVRPTTAVPSADPEMNLNGTENYTTCILLKGRFLFLVTYPQNDSTHGSVKVGVHDVTSMKGDCDSTMKTNKLLVTFFKDWQMVIVFGADKATTADDDGDDTFWWQQLNLTYTYDEMLMPALKSSYNGTNTTVSTTLDHAFKASMDGSYKCTADTVIDLSDGAKLTVSDMQYQAFQINTTGFQTSKLSECTGDSSTNCTVTLAVAGVLIALLVIYVAAFVLDRTRVCFKKPS